jgi:hypothetical protein
MSSTLVDILMFREFSVFNYARCSVVQIFGPKRSLIIFLMNNFNCAAVLTVTFQDVRHPNLNECS